MKSSSVEAGSGRLRSTEGAFALHFRGVDDDVDTTR